MNHILKNKAANQHVEKNSIWIGGDFNFPEIDWEIKSINNNQFPKQLSERFIDLIDSCIMEQVVNLSTRKENTLDLLITNRPPFINRSIPVRCFENHDSEILFNLICHPQAIKLIKKEINNRKRANLEELRKNVKEQMAKFVRENQLIPQSIIYGSNLVQQLSNCKKKLFQAECHQLVTVNLGLIGNEKKICQEEKAPCLYNKAKEQALDTDWFRFKDTAARLRKTYKKAYDNFISSSVASSNKSNSNFFN